MDLSRAYVERHGWGWHGKDGMSAPGVMKCTCGKDSGIVSSVTPGTEWHEAHKREVRDASA